MIAREWHSGDTVDLTLDMPVERIAAHPLIRQDAGQIALQRGPLVYCLEEVDNGARLANVILPKDSSLKVEFDPELFGGIAVITGDAIRLEPSQWQGESYQPQTELDYTETNFRLKALPYYLWANREPGEMRVWIREA